jgi:thiol peroxidase
MATVTLQGNELHTTGDLPAVGSPAPDFVLVDGQLANKKLSDFSGKKIIMNIVPSLDTPTCATSTKTFNKHAGRLRSPRGYHRTGGGSHRYRRQGHIHAAGQRDCG